MAEGRCVRLGAGGGTGLLDRLVLADGDDLLHRANREALRHDAMREPILGFGIGQR